MPIQRPKLVNNEIYHIVLRGVGDSLIFKSQSDYQRVIISLYEFNTTEPVEIEELKLRGELFSPKNREDLLVEILAFCLMPNHLHLLIRQIKDEGITRFMRKFGAGYAAYFNKKYNRKGHLFQGRFKAIYIKSDEQLQTVFVYIHTNPISLIEPNWKEKGIRDFAHVIKFLENYKWSSYPDYIGKDSFPSPLDDKDFILEVIGGMENCKKFIADWIGYKEKRKSFSEVELE